MKKLWDEARANVAKLDACANHAFAYSSGDILGRKYTCANCGGTIRGVDLSWYLDGRKHGAAHGAGPEQAALPLDASETTA